MTFGSGEIVGVVPRHRLHALQQALEAPALTTRLGEFGAEPIDFAAEVHDLAADRSEIALGIGRRRDFWQALL